MTKNINWPKLITSFLFCQSAGLLGTIFTMRAIPTWYADIVKPSFSPPNWIFGPAWLTLYALMAIALYLVWDSNSPKKSKAIGIFAAQLFLNAIWTPIFFGLHSPFLGFITIAMLWVFIILTMASFYKVSKTAFVLLIPYILWVSFAALLNFSIWQLN